ncbi:MAG TPA: helix-hairpin-helix domain-containing protein [Candidatus Paceibacterota bacterium]|nr:helix-hairpin-helix domain-containing protein [Candidatus Paceibacterota bacterium]
MKKIFITLVLICLPLFVGAQININTASLTELDDIPYVGETIARNIVEYRNTNGPFKKIEDIINVSRIGDSNFLKMKDYITVGSSDSSPGNSGSSPSDQTTNDDSDVNTESDPDSAHTGEVSLSDYSSESFKIGAGRERLATIRTPILFTASQNKIGKEKNIFTWSFGDGTSAVGNKIYHTYQFPGRYNVVLNGIIDDKEEAVARTTVLVTEPKIKITALDVGAGYVEISNDSDKEQNLNSWSLRASQKIHVFPVDTIISPKSSVKIPLKTVKLVDPEIKEIFLAYPDGGVISGASLANGVDEQKIAELRKELAKVRQQIARLSTNQSSQTVDLPQGLASGENVLTEEEEGVVVLEKKVGWLGKIKNAIFK